MAMRGVRVWTDPAELEKLIEDYFDSLVKVRKFRGKGEDGKPIEWEEEYTKPPTMAGLAHHLGVIRQTLINYQGREEFIPVLARAKNRVAMFAEEALYHRESSTGAQFALRVNHKYGEENAGGTGEAFVQQVIPPAQSDLIEAIPVWDEGDDDA